MAGASLLVLIDDIATILDDVAVLTKVAAKKTAGVLGDDLALNAQQVAGVAAERELPVVWAVCVGSLKNKLILVPAALAISAFIPWLVTPLLMIGGIYLCFEGVEKLAHPWLHSAAEDEAHHASELAAVADTSVDMAAFEAEKIKGAIRTDFVLSAEIIVIALGIVKMDDVRAWLLLKGSGVMKIIGKGLLLAAPKLMKLLSIVGTAAMFLVGGGILSHGVPALHHGIEHVAEMAGVLSSIVSMSLDGLVGIVAGAVALLGMLAFSAVRGKFMGVQA